MSGSVRGRWPTQIPFRVADKMPLDIITETLDLTSTLGADSIRTATASVAPSQPGGLVCATPIIDGALVSLRLSGGAPGTDYAIDLVCNLTSGNQIERQIGAYVLAYPFPETPT